MVLLTFRPATQFFLVTSSHTLTVMTIIGVATSRHGRSTRDWIASSKATSGTVHIIVIIIIIIIIVITFSSRLEAHIRRVQYRSHYEISATKHYKLLRFFVRRISAIDDFETAVGVSTSKISLVHILSKQMAAMKINNNFKK